MTIKPCKNCLFDLCGTLVDIHTDEDAPLPAQRQPSAGTLPGVT